MKSENTGVCAGSDEEYWDVPGRKRRYSIVKKRERLDAFFGNPSRRTLVDLGNSLWVGMNDGASYVDRYVLAKGHTPDEIAGMIREVEDGTRSLTDPDIPGMRMPTVTEVLQARDPDRYATYNTPSKDGLRLLVDDAAFIDAAGSSEEAYRSFVETAKTVVDQYDLRERLLETAVVNSIPEDASATDIADFAFHLHADSDVDFDLGEIHSTAERDDSRHSISISSEMRTVIEEVVEREPLYEDVDEYIVSAIRRALREDRTTDR